MVRWSAWLERLVGASDSVEQAVGASGWRKEVFPPPSLNGQKKGKEARGEK